MGYAIGSVLLGGRTEYKAASLAILASVATSVITNSAVHTTLETRTFTCRWAGLFANDGATADMVAAASIERATNPLTPIAGLYYVTALVGAPRARLFALFVTLLFGIPTLAGLCYGIRSLIKSRDKLLAQDHREVVRLALLVLATSWFGWYVILSIGWPRYLFPVTLVGSIFLAALLGNLTENFSLLLHNQTCETSPSKHRRLRNHSVGVLLAMLLVMISVPMTLRMLYQSYVVNADASVLEVIDFLNTQTPSASVIETYDPELFFLLNRSYHYPPDQIHVDLIRRNFLKQHVSIDYDPLAADPDYLVVGPHSKLWKLYDRAVESGSFRLIPGLSPI